MANRGVLFALDDEQVNALVSAPDDDARRAYVEDEVEDLFFDECPELLAETDKAWDAMHRSLARGAASAPLAQVILGGRSLHSGDDYVLSLKEPAVVRELAPAVAAVTRESLRAGYDAIDPADYDYTKGDDDFEYTWQWFVGVQSFWARAAERDLAVLFTVDR